MSENDSSTTPTLLARISHSFRREAQREPSRGKEDAAGSFEKSGLATAPLVPLVLAAGIGILAADTHPLYPLTGWLALAALSAAIFLALSQWKTAHNLLHSARRIIRHLAQILAIAALFAALHSHYLTRGPLHPLLTNHSTAELGKTSVVHAFGSLRQPQIHPSGRLTALLTTSLIEEDDTGRAHTQNAKLRVTIPPHLVDHSLTHARWTGIFLPHDPKPNPHAFDTAGFALRQNIIGNLQIFQFEPAAPSRLQQAVSSLRTLADHTRNSILQRLALGLHDHPEALNVIQSMVLGASDETDPQIQDTFRKSGALHIFAVSGLHVGLITLIFWCLLLPLRLRREHLILILIPAVFSYAFITGWRPSAARAAFMISLLLLNTSLQRHTNPLNNIALAALLLLLANTQQLFHIGFQLSFGVMLALFILHPKFMEKIRPWVELDPFLPHTLATKKQRLQLWFRSRSAQLACTSLAAWLGSFPLMLLHFQTITPVGILANCLLLPLAFLCLTGACLGLLTSLLPITTIFTTTINLITASFAKLMLTLAGLFAALPAAHIQVPPISVTEPTTQVELHLLALPDGQQSTILRVQKHHWLIDTGHQRSYNQHLLPTLNKLGISSLRGIILTHADSNHIGAAPSVLTQFQPRIVAHPPHEPWRLDRRSSGLRHLLEQTLPNNHPDIHLKPLHRGDTLHLSPSQNHLPASLLALYPGPADLHNKADDRCLISLIQLGKLRILYLADAGLTGEFSIQQYHPDLRCHILIKSAHGSDTHGSNTLLSTAQPKLIIAQHQADRVHLNAPESLRHYASSRQIPLLLQPETGGIQIRMTQLNSNQVTLSTHLTKEVHQLDLSSP